ncbi:MAG: Mu transposase C-terminal domain-containing protein, partial [Burkholderiaceae bacterium]
FYQHKPHKILMDTPANRWIERTSGHPIPLPLHAPDLEAAFAVPEERTLTHKGIELFNMFYNSDECQLFRMRKGEKLDVVVRYVPQDLGYIYLQETDTQRVIKVPVTAKYREYANGLSKWQHKICRTFALNNFKGSSDINALAAAKARIASIVEEQIFQKRRTLRKREGRFQNGGTKQGPKKPIQPTDVAIHKVTPDTGQTIADLPHDVIRSSAPIPANQYVSRSRD